MANFIKQEELLPIITWIFVPCLSLLFLIFLIFYSWFISKETLFKLFALFNILIMLLCDYFLNNWKFRCFWETKGTGVGYYISRILNRFFWYFFDAPYDLILIYATWMTERIIAVSAVFLFISIVCLLKEWNAPFNIIKFFAMAQSVYILLIFKPFCKLVAFTPDATLKYFDEIYYFTDLSNKLFLAFYIINLIILIIETIIIIKK